MIFGKIDFINLLPFNIYIKKNIKSSQLKQIIEYKKSYPSNINKKFIKKNIDVAFISSIKSRNKKSLNLGIIAKDEVLSVLLIPGKGKEDYQSETSNALAKILNLEGEVIIGDKALKHYYSNADNKFIDLAKQWKNQYKLPFVFAVLCINKNEKYLKNITKNFNKKHVKIPQYILNDYATKSNLTKDQISNYLKKIHYKIGIKEKSALKLFFKLLKQKGIL